jgi:hypothetical protein
MKSDDLGPYHRDELAARDGRRGVRGFRWRPLSFITSFALADLAKGIGWVSGFLAQALA